MAFAPEDLTYSPLTPNRPDEEDKEEEDDADPGHEDEGASTSFVHPGVQAHVDALIEEANKDLPESSPKRRRIQ